MNRNSFTRVLIKFAVLTLLMVKAAIAQDVTVIGSTTHTLKDSSVRASRNTSPDSDKKIQLLHIQLSDKAKQQLVERAKDVLNHTHQFARSNEDSSLPPKVLLEMKNVPVLDQGIHGTCVTFAVTGALDVFFNHGDYISQLCNLQLGSYLEKHGYGPSGWDGSYANIVISQIEEFGVANKQNQHKAGCGGLKHYPTNSHTNPDSFMEPEKFRTMSELVFGKIVNWSDVYKKNDSLQTLNEVKEALYAGDRLVFAVMFPRTDLGFVGAVGKYKTWIDKDTWVLTPEILKGVEHTEDAHEMIITGYDDNAVAVDNHGKKHTGLLKLRNSWGKSSGDSGEFYMSYDYFKLLTFDVTRFSPN